MTRELRHPRGYAQHRPHARTLHSSDRYRVKWLNLTFQWGVEDTNTGELVYRTPDARLADAHARELNEGTT